MLKPIDENELRENVKEVLAELEAKKNLDDYYTLSEIKARQVVLRRLLRPSEDKECIHREIKLYGMDFKYNCFCVAIISQKTKIPDKSRRLYEQVENIQKKSQRLNRYTWTITWY